MNKNVKTNILLFFILILGMSLFSYLPILVFHLNVDAFSQTLKVLYQLSCDIGFMIIVYFIYHKDLNKDFKTYFKKFDDNIKVSIKYYLCGYFVMVASNILIALFFSGATAGNENAVRSLIDSYPLYMFFSVAIYAPFIEEIIFRKCIYDIVYSFKETKYHKYIYIVISGLLFAGMHVIGITEQAIDFLYIIPYLGLGIAFAALYHKTKNIFSTITMHSMHNTLAFLMYFQGGTK